jgi:hypothetical protein
MQKAEWIDAVTGQQQIQRSGFDSRLYQIFLEVEGLERGPLNLVSTTEELLETKSGSSGLESREYGSRHLNTWHSPSAKLGTNFADKRRSLGHYSFRSKAPQS